MSSEHFIREPEPDLVMDDPAQVEAFTQAGKAGALAAIYSYHVEKATRTLFGTKRVLDLGCGSGNFLIRMTKMNPEIEFVGFDLSDLMLEFAKKSLVHEGIKNVELRKGDFSDLSEFGDHTIDVSYEFAGASSFAEQGEAGEGLFKNWAGSSPSWGHISSGLDSTKESDLCTPFCLL